MPVLVPPHTDSAAHILFDGLVDYAGLFPPAALSMSMAVRNYAHYRAAGGGWMLGRFICPSQALAQFSDAAEPLLPRDAGAIPWRISATGSGDIGGDLEQIAALNQRHRVCFEEYSATVDAYELKVKTVSEVEQLTDLIPVELTTYVEVPLTGDVEGIVAAIARGGRRAKIRTGGITADAVPSASDVVRFLQACTTHQVAAKATAGLHHPLRGAYRLTYAADAPTGRMFGFLNVVLAAALLDQGAPASEAIRLLEEDDAETLTFHDLHVAWRGPDRIVTLTRDALWAARHRGLLSFGSCSFTEPYDESRALGWM